MVPSVALMIAGDLQPSLNQKFKIKTIFEKNLNFVFIFYAESLQKIIVEVMAPTILATDHSHKNGQYKNPADHFSDDFWSIGMARVYNY
jgi:hypothetical protein